MLNSTEYHKKCNYVEYVKRINSVEEKIRVYDITNGIKIKLCSFPNYSSDISTI